MNPEHLKISSSVTDGAFLHSLLSIAALRQDLLRGLEVSKVALYHRGETIRLVREQLIRRPPEISEETIGAVASLSIFDVSDYAFSLYRHSLESTVDGQHHFYGAMEPLCHVQADRGTRWLSFSERKEF